MTSNGPRVAVVVVRDGARIESIDLTPTPAHAAALRDQLDLIDRALRRDALAAPEWLRALRRAFSDKERQRTTAEGDSAGGFGMVPSMPHLLTPGDVAERLNVSTRTAQRLMPTMGGRKVGHEWRLTAEKFLSYVQGDP